MRTSAYTVHSRLYQRFKTIEPNDYRQIVLFFEQYQKVFDQLETDEYAEILWNYCQALFEHGDYTRHLKCCDALLSFVMQHNLLTINGERIFEAVLFQKGKAMFNEMRYAEAAHVLTELLRINPDHEPTQKLLRRTLHEDYPIVVRQCRAIAIGLFLVTGFLVFLERVFIQHLFKPYQNWAIDAFEWTFCLGILVLTVGYLYQYWKIHYVVQRLITQAKLKKIKN